MGAIDISKLNIQERLELLQQLIKETDIIIFAADQRENLKDSGLEISSKDDKGYTGDPESFEGKTIHIYAHSIYYPSDY